MNFAEKWLVIAAGLICLPLAAFAQPGFGPGGPSHGRSGPGGPPQGHGYQGRSGPAMGGPMPSMGAPHFMGGPSSAAGPSHSPSGPPHPSEPRSMPSPMSPPSYSPRGGYHGTPADPQGVPTTRFGSIPNRPDRPPQGSPESHGYAPGPSPHSTMPPGAPAPADVSRMQQALRQRDYATIGKETEGIRSRTERIQRMGPDLPVQDRLQIPLINHMYRQGADLMEEGRSSRDDAKIRMGIQQIDQANEKLNHLKNRSSSHGRGRH